EPVEPATRAAPAVPVEPAAEAQSVAEPEPAPVDPASARPAPAPPAAAAPSRTPGDVSLQQLRDAWPEILDVVQGIKRGSWMVVYTSTPRAYDSANEVLTLTFPSDNDVQSFRQAQGAGDSVSEHLRQAILKVLGVRVKFIARVEGAAAAPAAPAAAPPAASAAPPAPVAAPAAGGWNVTPIPNSAPADDEVPPPGDDDMPPAFDAAPPPEDAWAAAPAPASTPEPAST